MKHPALVARAPSLAAVISLATVSVTVDGAPLNLSQTPLFVTSGTKANVLLILGNSNAMDEDPTGLAVGSAHPSSRSEIARTAARSLVSNYTGQINMGLMAYQQNNVVHKWINQSPYDVSYDPAHYNPSWTGARDSLTNKKFRIPNPTSPNPTGPCTDTGGNKFDCIYYNVNLPFYTSGPSGNGFCYSRTTGTSGYVTFPGDHTSGYYCYQTKTGTSNAADNVAGSGYANLIGGPWSFFPTDSDYAQAIDDFGRRNSWTSAGPTWFANTSPGLGYLHVPIANLDSAQAAKLNTKLATSVLPTLSGTTWNDNPTNISGGNTWNNANAPLINAGLTPITGTFKTARDYFNGTTGRFGAAQGGPQVAPPNSCNKDFVVFLTTGLPSVTETGGSVTAQYAPGVPYAPTETNNAIAAIGDLNSGTRPVKTYVIGFALPEFTNNYFVNNPPNPLDNMAAAGGTGAAHYANNLTSLNSTFSSIFSSIIAQAGSAAAVAMTSGSVVAGGRIYQGRFNSADWSGDLLAYNTNPSTGAITTVAWQAGAVLNGQNYNTGRSIITYKPSNSTGIPFRWPANPTSPTATELDIAQISQLISNPGLDPLNPVDTGANRLNFLRGQTGLSGFRSRLTSVLGDIVNSAPVYVGAPAFNYPDNIESVPYSTFRQTHYTRAPMIYVGANDGMLHAIDASNGQERLAYVPSQVYSNLSLLTTTNYNANHRYYVDGVPTVVDAFFSGAWRTMLVSGLGGGGRGVFALDITDPGGFSENNAASIVKWEFVDSDVGFVAGQPGIVKLNGSGGKWAAVFSNGYNSTTGVAALYIVDIETGSLIKKISTGAGSPGTPNALAPPVLVDVDSNGTADYAYAGDLMGNVWKFDLCNLIGGQCANTNAGWNVTKLFEARDGGGTVQPITSSVEVTRHFSGDGYQLFFGTGKYLEIGDISTTDTQSFYSLWDRHSAPFPISGRVDLQVQTVTSVSTLSGTNYRITSSNPVNWDSPAGTGTRRGWFMDLPASGERVVSDPSLFSGRILFTTLIPNAAACSSGGTGWLMELDATTGRALGDPTFDVDGDGDVDTLDNLGTPGAYASGVAKTSIPSAVRIQKNPEAPTGPLMNKWTSMSQQNASGTSLENVLNSMPPVLNRASWRQIFQ